MTATDTSDREKIMALLVQTEQAACQAVSLGSAMSRAMREEFAAAVVAVVAEKRKDFLAEFESVKRARTA